MRSLSFILSFLISFLTGVILHDDNNIKVRNYVLHSRKIKKSFSFALISDLHSKDFGYDNEYIVRKVIDANVDFVIMSGDILTSKRDLRTEEAFAFVKRLASICPVYYGIGNHEARLQWLAGAYYMSYDEYLSIIEECGASVLDNESVYLDEFDVSISGLNLPYKFYKRFKKNILNVSEINKLLGVKPQGYNILIAHNPEYYKDYNEYGSDLIVSGHLHGGVIRLPGNRGGISPSLKLLPSCAGGILKLKNNARIIISRGAGVHTIPVRVFNPCEISFVTVTKK